MHRSTPPNLAITGLHDTAANCCVFDSLLTGCAGVVQVVVGGTGLGAVIVGWMNFLGGKQF